MKLYSERRKQVWWPKMVRLALGWSHDPEQITWSSQPQFPLDAQLEKGMLFMRLTITSWKF